MPVAIITGPGGLIGSEAVEHFIAEGFDVVGIENDMRASFFGPESSTSHVTERLGRRALRVPLGERRHPRRRRRSTAIFRRARRPDRAGHPHRRPALPRLGRAATRRPTSASTPTAPSTCSRRPAPTAPRRPSSSARPTRSTATRRTGCRWKTSRSGWSCPRPTPTSSGIDTSMSIDTSHPLAVRRLQGGRRPAGPGVRPLLRHADRLLPRRLPDRPPARRRQAARLPRLPDEVHRHRHPVHRLRLRGQAGPRQHPQRRPDRRLRRLPQGPARGRRLQHRRRPLHATARCWRRSTSASGSPAAS